MPRILLRRWLVAAVTVASPGTVWFSASFGDKQTEPAPEEGGGRTKVYAPATSCTPCHKEGKTAFKDWPMSLLCECDEYKKWENVDKHADAYKNLLTERGRKMGEVLKVEVEKDPRCLNCHAVSIEDQRVREASEQAGFKVDEGVTCVVCHGPYPEWVEQHGNRGRLFTWRPKDKAKRKSWEQKEAEYGMTDLWDLAKRTKLCASCHIGNAEEGRFVTHDMYAAGHPPLPGFEAAFFCERMPRHWQRVRDKSPEVRAELNLDDKEQEETKLVLVGAAVSLAESMRLLADECRACEKNPYKDKRGLDLANFDCYACHHDLKSHSPRQQFGFAGKPGRVPMRPWPTALVELAVRHAAADPADAERRMATFRTLLQQVQAGFDARPFGSPARIAPAADALRCWANNLAAEVNKKPCDQAAGRKLFALLPTLYPNGVADYDSARQIGWALTVLYGERGGAKDPEVQRVLDSLRQSLKLDLPSGRDKTIAGELPGSMRALGDYDPTRFKDDLRALSNCLGKP